MSQQYKRKINKLVENTRECWDRLFNQDLKGISDYSGIPVAIRVHVYWNDEDEGDVLELMHFFPMADILLERNCPHVALYIKADDNDNIGRIKAFLSVQAQYRVDRRILFYINGIEVVFNAGPYEAPEYHPFFNDTNNREEKYAGSDYFEFLQKVKVEPGQGNRRIFLTEQLFSERQRIRLQKELLQTIRQPVEIEIRYSQAVSRIFPLICITNRDDGQDIRCADLLQTKKPKQIEKTQLRHLHYLCGEVENRLRDKDLYKGVMGDDIKDPIKQSLAESMSKLLEPRLNDMTLLSRLIFLYMLLVLLEEKALLERQTVPGESGKDESRWSLRTDVVEACWLDAESYAEGVYQLIENACLHSHGHKAYFGMRFYKVEETSAVRARLKTAQTVNMLYDRYDNCFGTFADSNPLFRGGHSHLIEFYVLDNAADGYGIVPTYNKFHGDKPVNSIRDIMRLRPDTSKEGFSEEFAEHYGLHVFRRIIGCNDGCIMAMSPNTSGGTDEYYSSGLDTDKTAATIQRKIERTAAKLGKAQALQICYSKYSVLLPVTNMKKEERLDTCMPEHLFAAPESGEQYYSIILNGLCKHSAFDEQLETDKLSCIKRIHSAIESAALPLNDHSILIIPIIEARGRLVELIAKALFLFVAGCFQHGINDLKIAVCFARGDSGIREFIRLVSVFYEKMTPLDSSERTLALMRDTQIAVCEKEESGNISVKFLLAGETLSSAYITAQTFLYYHFDTAINYVPQLRYLTSGGKNTAERTSAKLPLQFPFDLYLDQTSFTASPPSPHVCAPWHRSLFLDETQRVLERDVRERDLGCKLDGLKVRFGSKLYSDHFYEAVLLFRNVGNNYRFAYLITQDIIRKYNEKPNDWMGIKNVILVGYEAYSATLLLQVFRWLEDESKQKKREISFGACVLMAASHEERALSELRPISRPGDLMPSDTAIITVVPVGSTMSTMYKIREIVSSYFFSVKDSIYPSMFNYCILATNQCLKTSVLDEATKKYWSEYKVEEKLISVNPAQDGEPGLKVKFLLSAHSTWSLQRASKWSSGKCRDEESDDVLLFPKDTDSRPVRPVLQVDKTSTLLESIFPLKDRNYRKMGFPAKKDSHKSEENCDENLIRLGTLYGHISYAHICEGHNHYQFYINNGVVFRDNSTDIAEWLREIKIDQSAFNVIVSPLDQSNVPFVKCVIDNVFSSSIRYLHIDINNSFQEDFRLKYSFLADEYKQFRTRLPSAQFNIYFVDETIVSTRTISRAELLMRLLLEESGLRLSSRTVFTKVFLLLNHSSYDTLNNFVDRPGENVHSWINLSIPSYNTNADRCPACDLVDSYVLLRKRSSTERIGRVFDYLVDKHAKRSKADYDIWLHNAILSKHSYFVWLKQWLFFDVRITDGDISIWTPPNTKVQPSQRDKDVIAALQKAMRVIGKSLLVQAFGKAEPDMNAFMDPDKQEKYQNTLQQYTLRKLLSERTSVEGGSDLINEEDVVRIVKTYVIAKRDYMRLYCLHKAYGTLIYSGDYYVGGKAAEDAAQDAILKMICEELTNKGDTSPSNKSDYSRNAEWLISYIKILSRQHLVRHYHVCFAITNIMLEMLRIMMCPSDGASSALQNLAARLIAKNADWQPIINTLRCGQASHTGSPDPFRTANNNLCASLQYEIMMTLAHRLSVIQCDIICHRATMDQAYEAYGHLRDKYFGVKEYMYMDTSDQREMLMFTELPSPENAFRRYVKSVKAATMITNNDDPCYRLAVAADEMRAELWQ